MVPCHGSLPSANPHMDMDNGLDQHYSMEMNFQALPSTSSRQTISPLPRKKDSTGASQSSDHDHFSRRRQPSDISSPAESSRHVDVQQGDRAICQQRPQFDHGSLHSPQARVGRPADQTLEPFVIGSRRSGHDIETMASLVPCCEASWWRLVDLVIRRVFGRGRCW